MANNKIDRINKEIAKTREKITEYGFAARPGRIVLRSATCS